MHTAFVGRKFITYYNEKHGKDYTPKQFFDRFLWKYLYNISTPLLINTNCKLNPKGKSPKETGKFDKMERFFNDESYRKECLQEFHDEIEKLDTDQAHTVPLSQFPGFPSTERDRSAMSGTPSIFLDHHFTSDNVYCTYVGFSLSVSVNGILVLFDDMELNEKLFSYWKDIQKSYNDVPNLSSGILNALYGHLFLEGLPKKFMHVEPQPGASKKLSVPSVYWVSFYKALSEYFLKRKQESVTAYAYKFGNTNEMYGIVEFNLTDIEALYQIKDYLFSTQEIKQSDLKKGKTEMHNVIEAYYSFSYACKNPVIGTRALIPKEFVSYIRGRTSEIPVSFKKKALDFLYGDAYLLLLLTQKWSQFMSAKLNTAKVIRNMAKILAQVLIDYEGLEKVRTIHVNVVNECFKQKTVKRFSEVFLDKVFPEMVNRMSKDDLESVQDFMYQSTITDDQRILNDMNSIVRLIQMEYSILKSK